jgi:hypothetical protein
MVSPRKGAFLAKTLKTHNAAVIELANKAGGMPALADALGVHPVKLYAWARGQHPQNFAAGRYQQVNNALLRLTGKALADIFPPVASQTSFKPVCATHAACWRQHDALDLAFDLAKLTETLNRQQKAVLFCRMDGLTLEETGAELGVTRERVRQVECRARRMVWHRMLSLGFCRRGFIPEAIAGA